MRKTVIVLTTCALIIVFACLTVTAERNCAASVMSAGGPVVILDAGHGGEDGGAVAADGTREKDVNLLMTKQIAPFFDLFGIDYQTVRDDDRLVGDNTLPTVRERKVSDLHRRMEMVTRTPGAVLLSIHQNFFVREQFSGTQVFYAPNAAGSPELANAVQQAVVKMLQPENRRQVKPTEGTVYLLDKANTTSVMVECGFLSNREESALLNNSQYRTKLAYCIVRGLCDYINDPNLTKQ